MSDLSVVSEQRDNDSENTGEDWEATFVVTPTSQGVRHALRLVDNTLTPLGYQTEERATVELVLAEVLNNVVEHAVADVQNGRARICMCRHETGLRFLVEDNGRPMPPDGLPFGRPVASGTDLIRLPEGGFGWFMIREIARDLTYLRTDPVNRLTFRIAVG